MYLNKFYDTVHRGLINSPVVTVSEICTHMFWSEKVHPVYGMVTWD